MVIPTIQELDALHKKYAPTKQALESVWKHCHIVRSIALQIAENQPSIDQALVGVGALVHDIGVYRLYQDGVINEAKYITHGLLGYELLKEEGFDEVICRFALLHTGVGITKEDIQKNSLPLPLRDYIAETEEERIVMYADKFHSKEATLTFNSAEWCKKHFAARFGEHKAQQFEALVKEFGEPNLVPLMEQYGQSVR